MLDCAARLFSRDGYAAVSLRGIAAESGMKAGSLYYHFESKDAIVVAVLDMGVLRVRSAVVEAVAALPRRSSAADALGAAIGAHLRALHQAGPYTSANIRIFGQVPPAVRERHLPARRAYEALWAEVIGRGVASGEFRPDVGIASLRAFLLGAMNASLDWHEPRRGSVARVADDLSAIALRGVVAPGVPAALGP